MLKLSAMSWKVSGYTNRHTFQDPISSYAPAGLQKNTRKIYHVLQRRQRFV